MMILVCQISTHEKVNQVNALNHQCLSPRLSLTHLWIIKSKRSRTFTLAYDDSIRYTYNAKHVADYVLILRGTNLERCVGAVVLWHCKNVEYGECSEFWSEKYRSGSERVGVRDRLGEAIGKPVADLHGRLGQRVVESTEKRPKRPSSGFQQSDRSFSRHAKVRTRTPASTKNKIPTKKIAVFGSPF